jgi:GDPmannose 4,6-dehydratase
VINYREAYGIHASNGILFNHESPRRGETFVTRKVSRAVGRIKEGIQDCLYLGNLDSKRDWGYAPEYTDMMWRILQQDSPDDYVCATGETHSIREFCVKSFKEVGINLVFEGKDVYEVGIDDASGKIILRIDPKYFRPTEVDLLLGDPSKAKKILNWEPKVKFSELVKIMTKADWELAKKERLN